MSTPSPAVQYSDDGITYQSTNTTFNGTAGNSNAHIKLANSAGANFWTLTCIATDETSSAATVNASISINQTTKVATLTNTAVGTCMLMQSVVGITGPGLGANGLPVSSFTQLFEVNVLTTGGLMVQAVGETTELDPNFGYIAKSNQLARVGGSELLPYDLNFHEVANGSLPGFLPSSMITLDEEFTDSTLTRFTIISEGTPVTPVISGGTMTFSNTSGQNTGLQEGPSLTVPQFACAIHINSLTVTNGNTYANVGRGFAKDSNNYVMAVWRKVDGDASIQVKISGTSNFQATVSVSWTPPFDIGLSLVANSLVFWQKPNGGSWTVITSYDVSGTFNFKTNSLSGWKTVFWLAADDSSGPTTLVVSKAQTGSFGGTAVRDIVPMTSTNGSVVMNGSAVTCTCSFTDPESAAYCGVFTYDLLSKALTQTGVIFVNRSSDLQNDTAAHLIQDGSGGYYFFITTWGNAGTGASNINILYKHETSLNLTAGVNAIASMTQPSLPGIPSGGGTYDPYAILNGSTWYLAYTIGPISVNSYYPALATTPDLSTYTAVGQDTTAVPFEGTRIANIGGTYTVLASTVNSSATLNGAAGVPYARAYDLTMTWVGNVYVYGFLDTAANAYPPHCTLVPYGNYVYWLTFDNSLVSNVSNTTGQFRVFRAPRYQ